MFFQHPFLKWRKGTLLMTKIPCGFKKHRHHVNSILRDCHSVTTHSPNPKQRPRGIGGTVCVTWGFIFVSGNPLHSKLIFFNSDIQKPSHSRLTHPKKLSGALTHFQGADGANCDDSEEDSRPRVNLKWLSDLSTYKCIIWNIILMTH